MPVPVPAPVPAAPVKMSVSDAFGELDEISAVAETPLPPLSALSLTLSAGSTDHNDAFTPSTAAPAPAPAPVPASMPAVNTVPFAPTPAPVPVPVSAPMPTMPVTPVPAAVTPAPQVHQFQPSAAPHTPQHTHIQPPVPQQQVTPRMSFTAAANKTRSPSFSLPAAQVFDDNDLIDTTDGFKQVTRKALSVHEQALEQTETKVLSGMNLLKQRLTQDKISLEAAVANASSANDEVYNRLDQVMSEVHTLQGEVMRLREELLNKNKNQSAVQVMFNRIVCLILF
jgi:uncharacterized small protein (DUF1192 family)